MWIKEQLLEGEHVILEPLRIAHVPDLVEAVKDGEAWTLWYANVPSPDEMENYVRQAMEGAKQGNIAYAVRSKATDKIVGSTRYYQVESQHRRALIGYTWYADSVRCTAINTECKLLLLKELFETYDALAAEFRTHRFNVASRRAIERLGAQQDGILRNHMVLKNGSVRDTVVYSIIASEWSAVKLNLQHKLSQAKGEGIV